MRSLHLKHGVVGPTITRGNCSAVAIVLGATLLLATGSGCRRHEMLVEAPKTVGATHYTSPPPEQLADDDPREGSDRNEPGKKDDSDAEEDTWASNDETESSWDAFEICDLPSHARESPRFSTDSFALRPRGKQILDEIRDCLRSGPLRGYDVVVLGHADPRGSDRYNLELAMDRAESARRYLIRRGIAPSRVSVASRGEHQARGVGPESWQLDRRIEITVEASRAVGLNER